ncbi:Hpt domain-containing protein [Kaistia dalseonensis]|uniref:HPt (Histidine-containing phosphotransfer) domain-containing protein n=1 Tax=Kaistia dalseonensis TaxID=410840 RepID=A0ABU0HBJ9_9HYPH|nr:Hpt domain-containing protein [Kaistia dalseonensis]MCX5497056.1 Hpt domain-containing protein [Kaistia dalseonensis]MDQ0439682.1 HPt (histidine-containing phosphotransfer) domain-containing protein [Kaistia dalseonensis]
MNAIDQASLDRNTGADAALINDILRIFITEVAPEGRLVTSGIDPAERRRLAHRVRGAALGIGALALAGKAMVLERDPADAEDLAEPEDLAAFDAALTALVSEIERRLATA